MSGRPDVSIEAGTAVIDGRSLPIPNIEVVRAIDSGAHGSVFEARDTALDRTVALKIWYRTGDQVNEGAIGEVRKLAFARHPLFVTVHVLDGRADPPYCVMEYLPGVSLRSWIRSENIPVGKPARLMKFLHEHERDLLQRCKFWDLYSYGLRHLYKDDLLHGDPHVGNIIVFDDDTKSLDTFVRHHPLRYGDLSSIRMLDLGTSLLRPSRISMEKREARVILETATKLFPDIDPTTMMVMSSRYDYQLTLAILDEFMAFVLELASVPRLSVDDFVMMEHGLPQLLGWCPYFNYETVYAYLSELFSPEESTDFIIDTAYQMRWKHDEIFGTNTPTVIRRSAGGTAAGSLALLSKLGARLRRLGRASL